MAMQGGIKADFSRKASPSCTAVSAAEVAALAPVALAAETRGSWSRAGLLLMADVLGDGVADCVVDRGDLAVDESVLVKRGFQC